MECHLNELPSEMFGEILLRLDACSRLLLALTCKSFLAYFEAHGGDFLRGRVFSLHLAELGYQAPLELLVNQGCRLLWAHGCYAARGGHCELLEYLIAHGVPVDSGTADIAARACQRDVLDFLIKKGVKLTADTFLNIGCTKDIEFVKWVEERTHFLTRLRPNTFAGDCFLGAVRSGSVELCQYMATNYNLAPGGNDMTEAAGMGHLELFKWLYENVPEDERELDESLLSAAPSPHYVELLKYLISKGENIESEDVLTHALSWGHIEAIRILSTRTDWSEILTDGLVDTPVEARDVNFVKALVEEFGASIDLQTYSLGLRHGYGPMIEYLNQFVGRFNEDDVRTLTHNRMIDSDDELINDFFMKTGRPLDCNSIELAFNSGYDVHLASILANNFACIATAEAWLACVRTQDSDAISQCFDEVSSDQCDLQECRLLAEELGKFDVAQYLKERAEESCESDWDFWDELMAANADSASCLTSEVLGTQANVVQNEPVTNEGDQFEHDV